MAHLKARLSFLLLAACLGAQTEAVAQANETEQPPSKFALEKTVATNAKPEAATRDGDALLVSSLGPDNSADSGDGSIQRLLWEGSVDHGFHLATPLHNPKGIVAVASGIVVLDIDRVVVIARSGELRSEISLAASGTRFLNDVTMVDDHQVIVSATDIKRLFLINLLSGESRELQPDFDLDHPNGLHFDPDTNSLYITANGEHTLGEEGNGSVTKTEVDAAAGQVRLLWSSPIGKFVDGIDLRDRTIFVSDWIGPGADGAAYELDSETGEVTAREMVGVPGFADLLWDNDGRRVAFVSLSSNEVRFLAAPTPR